MRQRFPRYPFNRPFAGGVDIEHEERVGVVERRSEFFHQVAGSRVAMRLEDDVNLAECALAGGRERSFDFGRMMAVVVDNADACDASPELKTAVDAAELVERGTN